MSVNLMDFAELKLLRRRILNSSGEQGMHRCLCGRPKLKQQGIRGEVPCQCHGFDLVTACRNMSHDLQQQPASSTMKRSSHANTGTSGNS